MAAINWIWYKPNGSTVSPVSLPWTDQAIPRTNKSDSLIKACPDCSLTFVRQSDLTRHRRKHRRKSNQKRRFICPHCQAVFTFVCNMKRHIRQSCPNRPAPDGSGSNYSDDDLIRPPADPYGSIVDAILGTPIQNFVWIDYSPIILT